MAASREPQQLGKHDWYYEYPTHLYLVHEIKAKDGSHIRTDGIRVPWRMIARSIERAYRPRKRKKR